MIKVFYFILEIIFTLLDACIYYIFLRKFKKSKGFSKADLITIVFITITIIFLNYTIAMFTPLTNLIMNISWFIWAICLNKNTRYKEKFFHIILKSTINILCESSFFFPIKTIFHVTFHSLLDTTINRIFASLSSKILQFLIIKYVFSFKLEYLVQNSKYFLSMSILLILYTFVLFILSYNLLTIESTLNDLSTSISFLTFIIDVIILIVLHFIINFANKSEQLNIIKENYELQQHIINEQKLNINTIRKIQHEYKNNLSTINALLINNDIVEAKAFLTKILNISSTVTNYIKGTSFFEIIVNYKFLEAEANNIITDISINIPRDIPIDNLDIAILINNSFNNAIEACLKIDTSSRYIKCEIFIKGNYLNFYFENSCIHHFQSDSDELITTKSDKINHGYGIKNITSIVNKYDGLLKYNFLEGKYILKFSLLIPQNN